MTEEKYRYEEVAIRDHLLHRSEQAPDVQGEMRDFMERMEDADRKRRFWSTTAVFTMAAAAAIALFVYLSLPTPSVNDTLEGAIVAYQADVNASRGITLQSSNGEEMTVTQQTLDKMSKERKSTSGKTHVKYSLRTPSAMTASLDLPDGTHVMLNANSHIIYPESFGEGNREVEVKGEAFFEVAHDTRHPFVVKANGITTKVLGTKFNVRARSEKTVHVTLVEGSVEVTSPVGTSQTIVPGQDAAVTEGSNIEVTQPDIETYTAWVGGEFYFDNATIADIATEIGQWYNVSVIFNNPAKMQTRLFFAADRSATIDDVLRLLNMLDKASFTFEGNQIVIE